MNTFTVLTPVDTSTGVARIGKPHIVSKREEVVAASLADRIREAKAANTREDVTTEKVMKLKGYGMTHEEIMDKLYCSRNVVVDRLKKGRESGKK